MQQDSLILEILPKKEGHAYPCFRVYLPTTAGDGYYVRYNFHYEYNDVRENYAPNSTTNVSNYRIREAHLVRVGALTDRAVAQETVLPVLQSGEISLAIREALPDVSHLAPAALPAGKAGAYLAADFIGGYHGDERLTAVTLQADDTEISLADAVPEVRCCSTLRFSQRTTLYRWGTSAAESFGTPVAEHAQALTATAAGLQNRQELTWLRDDFHIRPGNCYLQMFTMRRESKGVPVCERFEAFDENGCSLGGEVLSVPVTEAWVRSFGGAARTVRYSSAVSGVRAEVGFVPEGDNLCADATNVHVRVPQGDNKWYAAFRSVQNGRNPRRKEHFSLLLHCHIDYVGSEKAR